MRRAARALCTAVSTVRPALALAALALAGACAGRPAADTGLNTDPVLADQLQRRNAPVLVAAPEVTPAAVQDSLPAPARVTEHARSGTSRSARAVARARPAARVIPPAAAPSAPAQAGAEDVGHAAGGEVASGGPSAPVNQHAAPAAGQYGAEPPVERQPQAHTARDGILASVAGAIIGAAASPHDRVRGGLIGAVAGGALGAVYGHSADRTYAGYSSYGSPSYGYRTSPGYRRVPTYRTF